MLRVPNVVGVAEFRREIRRFLDAVERGETYIIRGARGHREALVINPEAIRQLQDAYLELVGEVETRNILEDEDAMRFLAPVINDRAKERYTLDEVTGMVGEE